MSGASNGIAAFLRELPKAEIHVHLEGAIAPSTLLALARRHGVALPADDEAGLTDWFRFRDFEHFVQVYLACSRCLRDPEDFARLVRDFLLAQAARGIVYCEAHFTISTHVANGAKAGEVLDAVAVAIAAGEEETGVRLRLIPDIVRNVGVPPADLTLEWALAGARRGIVAALGLAGSEARFSCEPFAPHFAEAERRGLHRVAHAGEHAGPTSVRAALALGAERIGHGVRTVEDPALLAEVVADRVPLELCPTSNLLLGVAPDLRSHPIARLRVAGAELSINSDDPALFAIDLPGELGRLHDELGWSAETLTELALAGFRHAFLPAEEKALWERELRSRARELGERHLGRAIQVSG
ncbi:MAG: adenosine deaminase [Holophagales bacterium]|nr:MAG: adenosine deaminase [Holophagales bacterium]